MHGKAEAQREGRKTRKAWVKPEVRKLSAGSAEAAGGLGVDAAIFS